MVEGRFICTLAWRSLLFYIVLRISSANAAPKTVYIASTRSSHDNIIERALVSAINYINKDTRVLPYTDIKLFTNTTTSIKENLLEYVKLLLQHDVIALVVNSRPEPILDILGSMTHIPMVTMHDEYYPRNETQPYFAASLGPSRHDVRWAMIDVIKNNDWSDILVIYDVRWRRQANAFVSILPKSSKYSKIAIEIDDERKTLCTNTKRQLSSLHNAPVQAIALFCDSDIVAAVIDQVHCICSFRIEKPHVWLMGDMIPSLNMAIQSSQILLAFMPSVVDNKYTQYLTADLQVNITSVYNSSLFALDAALVTTHALDSLIKKGMWLQGNNEDDFTISVNGPRIYQQMKKLEINSSTTGFVSFGSDGTRRNMTLEVLNLRENTFVKIGTWNSTSRLSLSKKIIQNRPSSELIPLDKLNRRLKVVVVVDPPFVIRNADGALVGYSIDLIKNIANMLHFRYEIYLAPDGLYGGKAATGEYNGIVGQLIKGLADISTSPLTINSERLQILEFSKPFMQFTMSLITKKLDFDNQDLMAFMMPYSSTVWLLTIACLIVVTALMYVVNYISPYGYRHTKSAKNGEAFNLFNSLWFCLASMLQQGADNTPRSLSGRVLAGCFWFFILIWISTYTANLAAFFTVRNARKPVSTLEEVVEGDYHFYIIRDTAIHDFFRVASYQTYRKLYERANAQQTFVNSTSDGYVVARKRKNSVFMAEKPSTEYVIMQEPCDLTAASGLLGASSYGIAMPKHYPYARNISVAVLTLHETGVLDSLWRKWWDYRSQCPKEQTRSAIGTGKQIELRSMIGVYVVLATGGISSIVLVLGEIYWSKHGRYFKALFRNEFGSFGIPKANANHNSPNNVPVLIAESIKTTDL